MAAKILLVFGTRPEAIKMAPVVLELRRRAEIIPLVCVTAQHRHLLDEALAVFDIKPDFDLNVMRPGQTLSQTTSAVVTGLSRMLPQIQPARILVHGDTTTTFAAALAGFYHGIPIGHVEAGLRTGNLNAPWPEEFNRRCVDMVADLLWAPTGAAAAAMVSEGAKPENVIVTGNTVVDALCIVRNRIVANPILANKLAEGIPGLNAGRKLILVTGHRRENFGDGISNICHALHTLATRADVEIVWPMHPNPNVVGPVRAALNDVPNVHLIEPLDYLAFTALMMRAYLIVTDSGGIQEEAPSLSKPVLVTRDETERPEAVACGTARLIGTSVDGILKNCIDLLDNRAVYDRMACQANPFGDGTAAVRIADSLIKRHRVN